MEHEIMEVNVSIICKRKEKKATSIHSEIWIWTSQKLISPKIYVLKRKGRTKETQDRILGHCQFVVLCDSANARVSL